MTGDEWLKKNMPIVITTDKIELTVIAYDQGKLDAAKALMRPCPFCGNKNLSLVTQDNDNGCVECESCNAEGPLASNFIEAIRLWNGR